MKSKKLIVIVILCALIAGLWLFFFLPKEEVRYNFRYTRDQALREKLDAYTPVYPDCNFMVISDLHLYDPSLGTTGPAFEAYLDEDRKLLRESSELLDAAVARIAASSAQFVIIPGDLTKDGEAACHKVVAAKLAGIQAAGKQVFVVPGNHDINNADAFRFTSTGKEKIDTIQAADFAAVYNSFGYAGAIERDPASLSYVTEPVPGLWLLGLDACRYRENKKDEMHIVAGKFQQETIDWIEKILDRAVAEKKAVIAFMHHGVVEHFASQAEHFGEYLVAGYKQISDMFSTYKVSLVCTGHFHAQDITLYNNAAGSPVFDIETGSLVTYPSPVRSVSIRDNGMSVDSYFIPGIPSRTDGFPEYSRKYVHEGIKRISIETMKKYWVPEDDALRLAPQVADAFLAHYSGTDLPAGTTIDDRTLLDDKNLSFMGSIVLAQRKSLVVGLWHDLAPADNKLFIDLITGQYR